MKKNPKKKLLQISDYYSTAWHCIHNNNLKQALKIIHNLMPVKLYDLSLDILDNTNKFTHVDPKIVILYEETRHLIIKVDNKLSEISTANYEDIIPEKDIKSFEFEDLQKDKFKKQF